MKKIATLLVFLFGVSLVQGQTCAIRFGMQNRNRNVFGEVGAECPGINNSPPWGNWGGRFECRRQEERRSVPGH